MNSPLHLPHLGGCRGRTLHLSLRVVEVHHILQKRLGLLHKGRPLHGALLAEPSVAFGHLGQAEAGYVVALVANIAEEDGNGLICLVVAARGGAEDGLDVEGGRGAVDDAATRKRGVSSAPCVRKFRRRAPISRERAFSPDVVVELIHDHLVGLVRVVHDPPRHPEVAELVVSLRRAKRAAKKEMHVVLEKAAACFRLAHSHLARDVPGSLAVLAELQLNGVLWDDDLARLCAARSLEAEEAGEGGALRGHGEVEAGGGGGGAAGDGRVVLVRLPGGPQEARDVLVLHFLLELR